MSERQKQPDSITTWEFDREHRQYSENVEERLENLCERLGWKLSLFCISRTGTKYFDLFCGRARVRVRVSDHYPTKIREDFSFNGTPETLTDDLSVLRDLLVERAGRKGKR